MVKSAVLGVLLALLVACGSEITLDETDPGGGASAAQPTSSLGDSTGTPGSLFTPSPTSTTSPGHQSLAPCPIPEIELLPTDDFLEDVTGWPESSYSIVDPHGTTPWGPDEVLPGVLPFPAFQLSGGLRLPTDVTDDGPVTIGIAAHNGYQRRIAFGLSRDPGYDFAIYDSSGQEVWRYSEQVEFTERKSELDLAPQEERLLEAKWDLTGKDEERVRDGTYWVHAIVFREEPYRWHVAAKQMYIGERPSLNDALELKLITPETVLCGDRVPMTLTITNISDSPVNIFTGVDFDNYHASPAGGEEFWNWWKGKTRILPLFVRFIAPGETVLFRRSWQLENGEGGRVVPGKYELRASIKAAQVDDLVNRTEIAWSNIAEITVKPCEWCDRRIEAILSNAESDPKFDRNDDTIP